MTRSRRLIAAATLAYLAVGSAQAQQPRSFIIPPSDGYGVSDCLAGGGVCGRVVADSWCEAHGLSAAVTFGPADDVTAAIGVKADAAKAIEPGSYVIDCSE